MNIASRLLCGSALLSLAVSSASAGLPEGFYVSAELGRNWADSARHSRVCNAVHTVTRSSTHCYGSELFVYDDGWAAIAAVGFELTEHWKLEAELSYRIVDVGAAPASNAMWDLHDYVGMANVVYERPLDDTWSVSLGAGIGVARETISWGGGEHSPTPALAYQGLVGAGYRLSESTDVIARFRVLKIVQPTNDLVGQVIGAGFYHEHDVYDDTNYETLSFGIRYRP